MFETANICNERPISLSAPRDDGTYVLITPNQLMMGRSHNIMPDDTGIADSLPVAARYRIIHHCTTMFWEQWSRHVSPGLVVRQKWHSKDRNTAVGDLVMICESSKIKAKYKLAVVDEVKKDNNGVVRSATVRYCTVEKNPRGDNVVTTTRVKRAVQRLVLVMPTEETSAPIVVRDHGHYVQCSVHI
jgi:hypothetical protein